MRKEMKKVSEKMVGILIKNILNQNTLNALKHYCSESQTKIKK